LCFSWILQALKAPRGPSTRELPECASSSRTSRSTRNSSWAKEKGTPQGCLFRKTNQDSTR
jgi:hypothetical protein